MSSLKIILVVILLCVAFFQPEFVAATPTTPTCEAVLKKTAAPTKAVPQEVAVRFKRPIRLIALTVAKSLPSSIELDDLIQQGFLGLIEAWNSYDPGKANLAAFESYAVDRIRGAMFDSLRKDDPLKRRLRAFQKKVAASRSLLEQRLGRQPSNLEVSEHMGLEFAEFQVLLRDSFISVQFYDDLGMNGDLDSGSAIDFIDRYELRTDEPLALHRLEPSELLTDQESPELDGEILRMLIENLPRIHKGRPGRHLETRIIRLRDLLLGLLNGETLAQIGERLGVNEARACQLKSEALGLLREAYLPVAQGEISIADFERRHLVSECPSDRPAEPAPKPLQMTLERPANQIRESEAKKKEKTQKTPETHQSTVLGQARRSPLQKKLDPNTPQRQRITEIQKMFDGPSRAALIKWINETVPIQERLIFLKFYADGLDVTDLVARRSQYRHFSAMLTVVEQLVLAEFSESLK